MVNLLEDEEQGVNWSIPSVDGGISRVSLRRRRKSAKISNRRVGPTLALRKPPRSAEVINTVYGNIGDEEVKK